MKGIELGLLVTFFSLSYCAGSRNCFTRKEKKQLAKMRMDNQCKEPSERFVHLPVPTGYDYVMPSTAKVKRCDGYCWKMKRECLPTSQTMKSVKVQAVQLGMGSDMECTEVKVEEHMSCGCNCINIEHTCSETQEFVESLCTCVCKEELQELCAQESNSMWDATNCECIKTSK